MGSGNMGTGNMGSQNLPHNVSNLSTYYSDTESIGGISSRYISPTTSNHSINNMTMNQNYHGNMNHQNMNHQNLNNQNMNHPNLNHQNLLNPGQMRRRGSVQNNSNSSLLAVNEEEDLHQNMENVQNFQIRQGSLSQAQAESLHNVLRKTPSELQNLDLNMQQNLDPDLSSNIHQNQTSINQTSITEEFNPNQSLYGDPNSLICDDDLVNVSVRELNRTIRTYPREVQTELKKRRRTLKNRGYAQICRQKRVENKHTLEIQCQNFREENAKLMNEVMLYKAKLEEMQAKFGSIQMDNQILRRQLQHACSNQTEQQNLQE